MIHIMLGLRVYAFPNEMVTSFIEISSIHLVGGYAIVNELVVKSIVNVSPLANVKSEP